MQRTMNILTSIIFNSLDVHERQFFIHCGIRVCKLPILSRLESDLDLCNSGQPKLPQARDFVSRDIEDEPPLLVGLISKNDSARCSTHSSKKEEKRNRTYTQTHALYKLLVITQRFR
jgi:hypothetical protein